MKKAVRGAGGTHIVLPGYYTPSSYGMCDMQTSDGRFMFILPWMGHTLVGTTDVKTNTPDLHPPPMEDEIQWLLCEFDKYFTKELRVRRADVLSAWLLREIGTCVLLLLALSVDNFPPGRFFSKTNRSKSTEHSKRGQRILDPTQI
jgi:glycerol-3-phosphate dehydrogenase